MTVIDENMAFEKAKFGIEVERFVSSPVGRFLIAMAERDAKEAIEELKCSDTDNAAEMRRIKDKITIPDRVVKWLSDAIQEGRACEHQLQETEG